MITSKNRWWIRGLFFGAFMFLFMGVLQPIAEKEELSAGRLVLHFLYWTMAGLVLNGINLFIYSKCKTANAESSGTE